MHLRDGECRQQAHSRILVRHSRWQDCTPHISEKQVISGQRKREKEKGVSMKTATSCNVQTRKNFHSDGQRMDHHNSLSATALSIHSEVRLRYPTLHATVHNYNSMPGGLSSFPLKLHLHKCTPSKKKKKKKSRGVKVAGLPNGLAATTAMLQKRPRRQKQQTHKYLSLRVSYSSSCAAKKY